MNYPGKVYRNTEELAVAAAPKSIVRESESSPICILAFDKAESRRMLGRSGIYAWLNIYITHL